MFRDGLTTPKALRPALLHGLRLILLGLLLAGILGMHQLPIGNDCCSSGSADVFATSAPSGGSIAPTSIDSTPDRASSVPAQIAPGTSGHGSVLDLLAKCLAVLVAAVTAAFGSMMLGSLLDARRVLRGSSGGSTPSDRPELHPGTSRRLACLQVFRV